MKIAAIAHVWYPELWPELSEALKQVDVPFDLYATCRDPETAAVVCSDFPQARIVHCENRGFDLWPFLKTLDEMDIGEYDWILKLHTKRDFPSGTVMNFTDYSGPRWRRYLLSFLNTPEAWRSTRLLMDDPRCGIIADARCVFARNDVRKADMYAPFDNALRILRQRFGLSPSKSLMYVGGTMFLVRASLLAPLKGAFRAQDFDETRRDDLSNLAYTIERLIGFLVGAAGMRIDSPGVGDGLASWRRRLCVKRALAAFARFFWQCKRSEGRLLVKILKVPVFRCKIGRTYDFVFGLGDGCCCSQALRKAGLQKGSLPFDWRGAVGLSRIVEIVADDFKDWSREEDIEVLPDKDTNTPHHYCVNRHNGLVIPHDFPVAMSLHEGFPAVQAAYDRRLSRFRSYAASAKRMLAVYVNMPNYPDIPVEEIVRCHDALAKRFPHAQVDLLCYFCREGHGVADREVLNPAEGVRIVSFDYRYFGTGGTRFSADYDKIALTLADIRARDCRTRAEKRTYAAKLKRDRYASLKAKTPWEYFINRIEYKIVRHLGKRLAKRGVKLNI